MNYGDDEHKIVPITMGVLVVCLSVFLVVFWFARKDQKKPIVYIDWNSPQFIGKRSGHYSAIFGKTRIDKPVPEKVKEEFEEEKEEFEIAHTNTELIDNYGISFKEGTLSDLAIDCNTKLFELCNKYFLASYGGQQASPLIPMAISTIETPHRVDWNVTYCALFPSKYIALDSASQMENMSCLVVVESPELFSVLANDHWTRDRGALQMNPTYGTDFESFNSLMGPSEAEILGNVDGLDIDWSQYVAYEPRNNRNISGHQWLEGISNAPGDRFNIRDSLLRLSGAAQIDINLYAQQYEIHNDNEMMCLIAMAHNAGSVWNPSYANKRIGNWVSGTKAHEYCVKLTSQDFQWALKEYCQKIIDDARANGKQPAMTLDRSDAKRLYEQYIGEDYRNYVAEGNYYEVTYCYPIQALYNYMMLGLVYSGK